VQESELDCRNCGAPLTFALNKGHFVCEYCGSLYFPDEPDDGVLDLGIRSEVECPVCREPLVLGRAGTTQVLYCQRCKGLLIPQAAFVLVVQFLRATAIDPPIAPPPMNRDDLRRRIGCPHCGRTMDTHPYGGPGNIVIDNCPHCHVNWLDYHEFQRIIDAPGGDRRRPH
jgi:Zn-finger nucleic acid-binding protein